jgi:TonB family protein
MEQARRHRSIIIIFIIILLLHLLALWFILCTSFNTPDQMFHEIAQKTIKPDSSIDPKNWAALHAKPAAPVLFKTIPSTTSPSVDDKISPKPEQKKEEPQPQEPPAEPKEKTPQSQLITTQKSPIQIIEKEKEKTPSDSHTDTIITSPKKIPELEPPKEKSNSLKEKPSEKKTNTQEQSPNSASKKLSFNTLAQGFAQHMHAQGKDEVTMRGAEKGKATAEQLRYAHYGSKICSTITNAFTTSRRKLLFTDYAQRKITIRIVINKNGSLKDICILESSMVPSIDSAIIATIKDASQGFPPLPDFFNVQQFPLIILFNDAMQIIEHPEQSYWTL